MRKLLLLLFALPFFAHAQLREVKQVIYGMDCAPCARGVEASIKRLDGVRDVTMSLNNGTAFIQLSPENHLKLDELRQLISDNGFTPKEAEVKLSGMLRENGGSFVLQTTSGETFSVDPPESTNTEVLMRLTAQVGRAVTIAGRVADTEKEISESWVIRVEYVVD